MQDLPLRPGINQMEGKEAVNLDPDTLSQDIGLPVIAFNARKADAQTEFFKSLSESDFGVVEKQIINMKDVNPTVFEKLEELVPAKNHYDRIQQAAGHHRFSKGPLDAETEAEIHKILVENKFHKVRFEATETLRRYKWVDAVLSRYQLDLEPKPLDFNSKLDKILTHKIWGYTIFLGIMFLLFQAIFAWSSLPMEWIEQAFSFLGEKLSAVLPEGKIQDLIVDGLLAGLSGVLIFIPQIAFLFLFIGILEETGYMARVSFIMDRILKRYGLNGKSVVPLISGIACAVPAIMAARTIQNSRERLLTILVTPLMSCSARLPVYTLLISLVIPAKTIAGLQLQGLVLMAFYLLGFLAAIGVSWVFKQILKTKERSYFIMELPDYKLPDWRSVGLTIYDKVKVFVIEAGKIILAISVLLWIFSTYGPADRMAAVDQKYEQFEPLSQDQKSAKASEKLENSFVGILGKTIEPTIEPLGFDWKMGIALITSFAAREVFVGSMGTIYSVQDPDDHSSVREKMRAQVDPKTGRPQYSLAVGISLMLFYAFAMQCMSTLAISYRETGGWKWPTVQFLYMGGLAYLASLIAYQLLS